MNSAITGKDYLDPFFAGVTALISRGLENLFGSGVNSSVFGNVTWADLGTVLCLVLVVLIVHGLAAAFLRRKTRQAAATAGKELHHHVFGALGKPLYLLIWICGIYLAATPLLLKLPPDESLRVVRTGFDKLFDLGVFATVFWLFFRFTRVLEARLAALAAKTGEQAGRLVRAAGGAEPARHCAGRGRHLCVAHSRPATGIRGRHRQRHQHPADRGGGADFISSREPRRKSRVDEIRHQCRGQFTGAKSLHAGPRHQQNNLRHHRPVHRGVGADAVRGSAAVRRQHPRVGGRASASSSVSPRKRPFPTCSPVFNWP